MTRGEKQKNRRINNGKRYRIRYDRIVILILVLIVLAVVITSCVKAFFGKEEPDNPDSSRSLSSETSNSSETSDMGEETAPAVSADTTVSTEYTTEISSVSATGSVTTSTTNALLSGYRTEIHSNDDIYKGDLVLVNAEHDYKFYEDDISPITLFDNKSGSYGAGDFITKLDKNVLKQLNEMIDAYAEAKYLDSTSIFILDGYRTYDEQVERHINGKSRTFEAGYTDYHTGRTFDMFCSDTFDEIGYAYFSPTGNYRWFAQNAGNYGFIMRFPEGKEEITGENARTYTYRYVGVPHAVYINSNNLCMEEYIELIKTYTNENPLEITADGQSYAVYYVPAGEDETDVPVPLGKMYKVSGNNADGFIVTVIE